MQEQKKGKWLRAEHVVSSSICPPAVRTVVLMVHANDHETPVTTFRDIVPVIAIESLITETYSKHTYDEKKYAPISSSKKALLDEGYSFYSREREIRLVHNNHDLGVDSSTDGDPGANGMSRIVVCGWPQEEDEKRFEPFFKDMEEELKSRSAVKSPA
jgi:hypothetical protein